MSLKEALDRLYRKLNPAAEALQPSLERLFKYNKFKSHIADFKLLFNTSTYIPKGYFLIKVNLRGELDIFTISDFQILSIYGANLEIRSTTSDDDFSLCIAKYGVHWIIHKDEYSSELIEL